jgi:hypothetical protein
MTYAKPEAFSAIPPKGYEMLLKSVEEYEPKREINLYLRRANGSGILCGRIGQLGWMGPTPAEFYEAALRGLSPAQFYYANRERIITELSRKLRRN